MTASLSPAAAAARRMTSDSNAFSRQPKVMISVSAWRVSPPASRSASNEPSKLKRDRPGHDHVPVLAPRDVERAAIELDGRAAPGQPAPMRRDERGAGAAAAGRG